MGPANGYLNRPQSMAPRKIQQFGVEPKSLNRLLLKDYPAALTLERLETALRIDKGQPQDAPHNFVENDSSEFAERRFVHGDQAAVHRPGADRYVAGLQRVNKFSGFLNLSGEVGIGEKRDAAARFLHAVAHTVAFAAVDTIRNHPKRGNLDAKILRHGGWRIIRGSLQHAHLRFSARTVQIRR